MAHKIVLTLTHMFLISSDSNNIMVEETAAEVITVAVIKDELHFGETQGAYELKPMGTEGTENNYVPFIASGSGR